MTRRKQDRPRAFDPRQARTYPLSKRPSLVSSKLQGTPPRAGLSVADFLAQLPDILAASQLRTIAGEIAARRRAGKHVLLGMGAHPIKVGLAPLIVDLIERDVLAGVAMNGAAIIHDFELAHSGRTSEDVAAHLRTGQFGMARETGEFLNRAIAAAMPGEGLGHAVGRAILEAKLPFRATSILAAACRAGKPATVHVTIGADIIHMHPEADGAAIGESSLRDFHLFSEAIAKLDQGVFLNLGSAVVIPEVFVKALNLARNLGFRVEGLLTADFDFIRHYRPLANVVTRPTIGGGQGYQLTGHHEILFPLLCAAIAEEQARPVRSRGKVRKS